MDANNVTLDTFSHTSNTQIDHANSVFTSEKIDKSDELVDAVNNMKINDAKYYESDIATTNDAHGDPTHNTETVNHTSNKNETVTHTGNGYFKQKIFINRNIPVVVPEMNPRIDQRIAPLVGATQTLLTPSTKEVVAYAALGSA